MAETTRMENSVGLFTKKRFRICDGLGGDFGAAQDAGHLHEALFAGDTADGSDGTVVRLKCLGYNVMRIAFGSHLRKMSYREDLHVIAHAANHFAHLVSHAAGNTGIDFIENH